jgi:hypothetical protein
MVRTKSWFNPNATTHHTFNVTQLQLKVAEKNPTEPNVGWHPLPQSDTRWENYPSLAEQLWEATTSSEVLVTQYNCGQVLQHINQTLCQAREQMESGMKARQHARPHQPKPCNTFWRSLNSKLPHVTVATASFFATLNAHKEQQQWSDARKAAHQLTEALMDTVKTDPVQFWKIIRETKRPPPKPTPTVLKNPNTDTLAENQQETEALWWERFQRKDWLPEAKKAKASIIAKRRAVAKWAKSHNSAFPIDRPPTLKELIEVIKSLKLQGAPGIDKVTAQMYLNAGPTFHQYLHAVLLCIWEHEIIPSFLLRDVVVPIHKRDYIHWAKNYRPISLSPIFEKILQKLLLKRIRDFEKDNKMSFISQSSYGGIKGRCRLQLVWTINAISLQMQKAQKSHYIVIQDIDNAFPSTDPNLADFYRYQQGLKGKVWRLTRLARQNLSTQLRLNGHLSKPKKHSTGLNQGDPLSVDDSNLLTSAIHKEIQSQGLAIQLPEHPEINIPGFSYIDDMIQIQENEPSVQKWLKSRSKMAANQRLRFKPSKDCILLRGSLRTPLFQRESAPPLQAKRQVKLLGEILTRNPSISQPQIDSTLDKMRAAARSFAWLYWKTSTPTLFIIKFLFRALVTSIATANLTLTRVSASNQKRLEAVQANAARNLINIHQRASVRPLFALLNWIPLIHRVNESKLLLLGTLLRQKDATYTASLVDIRQSEVLVGDRNGLFGETYTLLEKANQLHLFTTGHTYTKRAWKKTIKMVIHTLLNIDWQNWTQNTTYGSLWHQLFPVWPQGSPFEELNASHRQIIAAVALMVTAAKADKPLYETHKCRICNENVLETSYHLVTECSIFHQERRSLFPNPTPTLDEQWVEIIRSALSYGPGLTLLYKISIVFHQITGTPLVIPATHPYTTHTQEDIYSVTTVANKLN